MVSKVRVSLNIPLHLVLLLCIIAQQELSAIPAFARKYKTSCSTCHESITKRNAFGEAFRRVGYYIPADDMQKIREKPVSLGAEEWKDLWPEAVWPGTLPSTFPVALYSQMRINQDFKHLDQKSNLSFVMPRDIVLLFGGAFEEDVSFFGQWAAYQEGTNAAGLYRFFFQFNSIVTNDGLFNLRVGRFEPGITDGYTGSQKLTLSFPNTLEYTAGAWSARRAQAGIELNGIYNHRVYYAAGVVNGQGKTTDDMTDQKDVYVRFAYQFGGTGYDGRDTSLVYANDAAYDQFAAIGIYGYKGNTNQAIGGSIATNQFYRIGADVLYHYSNFDFLTGVIWGRDENLNFDNRSHFSVAAFAEVNYKYYPWLFGVLRAEVTEGWFDTSHTIYQYSIIPNITMLYRANIRLSAESRINIYGERVSRSVAVAPDNSKPFTNLLVNLMVAF